MLRLLGGLLEVEPFVQRVSLHQTRMRPTLTQLAILQNDDFIHIFYR